MGYGPAAEDKNAIEKEVERIVEENKNSDYNPPGPLFDIQNAQEPEPS